MSLKVYFSGCDSQCHTWYVPLRASGVKYRLFSAHKFISGDKVARAPEYKATAGAFAGTIVNAGLYTFMFGSKKGLPLNEGFMDSYYSRYVEFVRENVPGAVVMEVDCQKLTTPRQAWELRERIAADLPDSRVMSVFHLEDGKGGLDRLVDFSDYIAVDLSELRAARPKTIRRDTKAVVGYIKERKPGIDVHLLACTDLRILRDCNGCASADSTRWLSPAKYYRIPGGGEPHIDQMRPEAYGRFRAMAERVIEREGIEAKADRRTVTLTASACVLKRTYEGIAGNQE